MKLTESFLLIPILILNKQNPTLKKLFTLQMAGPDELHGLATMTIFKRYGDCTVPGLTTP